MIVKPTIGIDLGGTNMRAGIVKGKSLASLTTTAINAQGTAAEVVGEVFAIIEGLLTEPVEAIGIGVPGMVNTDRGVVFDVVNIPSWKELPLKQVLEERFQVPVLINNDANCFALGEYYFGKGAGSDTFVGLTIGTGLGSGIILNGKLHSGKNCGAGEFGVIDYLENSVEYYASGQFFQNVYQTDGTSVFRRAAAGDPAALKMYAEFGSHLGNAIKIILYSLEADTIILGGSVSQAWPYFRQSMWQRINTFAFAQTTGRLRIEVSELENSGVLGAAALHYDSIHQH